MTAPEGPSSADSKQSNVGGRSIHQAASTGFSRQADAYVRGRPTYHPDLAKRVAQSYTESGNGRSGNDNVPVVELGAGTGIFTRQMVAEQITVIAVEPVAEMRSALIQSLGGSGGGPVTAVDGTAEHMPLPDGAAQTVVASQSFHWFDYGPALDEIARVLQVGGHLVTVWNVRDETVPWVAACTQVMDEHAGDTPRQKTMEWRDAINSDTRFQLVEDLTVPNPHPTTEQGVVDRSTSTSFIAALDPGQRQQVTDRIREIVGPLGDTFDYPYVSELQAWAYTGDVQPEV